MLLFFAKTNEAFCHFAMQIARRFRVGSTVDMPLDTEIHVVLRMLC